MGQRCYLRINPRLECFGRYVPWPWYIVVSTPGTIIHSRTRWRGDDGDLLEFQSPLTAARKHFCTSFDAIGSFLWEAYSDDKRPGTRNSRMTAAHPPGSPGWSSLRIALSCFDPRDYLGVLKLLAQAQEADQWIELDASELVRYGSPEDRTTRLSIHQQLIMATQILVAIGELDAARLIRLTLPLDRMAGYIGYEEPSVLYTWFRLTYRDRADASAVAKYLLTEDEVGTLDDLDW